MDALLRRMADFGKSLASKMRRGSFSVNYNVRLAGLDFGLNKSGENVIIVVLFITDILRK